MSVQKQTVVIQLTDMQKKQQLSKHFVSTWLKNITRRKEDRPQMSFMGQKSELAYELPSIRPQADNFCTIQPTNNFLIDSFMDGPYFLLSKTFLFCAKWCYHYNSHCWFNK